MLERGTVTIRSKIWIIFLLVMCLPAGSAANAAEPAGVFWWEPESHKVHTNRGQMPVSMEKSITFLLCWGRFPHKEKETCINDKEVWIRSPDGTISEGGLLLGDGTTALRFPSKLNPAKSNGLYLVGIHVNAGVMDIDSDGIDETVHYYSKYLIYHQNEDGIQGSRQDVFFNDPDKIALEIGLVDTQDEKRETLWREADFQEALKEYRLKVLYKGEPLANADVSIFTESGWKKRAKTNVNGIFTFVPLQGTQTEEKVEKCLYVASFRDPLTGQYHCSSLMIYIKPHRPLYDSKARGFNLWAVLGASLFLLYVATLIYRKKRRADKDLAEFERHKIKEN